MVADADLNRCRWSRGLLVGSNNTGCCAIPEFPQAQEGSIDLAFARRSGIDEILLVRSPIRGAVGG